MSGLRHWILWSLLLIGGLHAETPLPDSPEPDYIRDDAKWLSPTAFHSLNEKLKAYERETSSQFVVAIFPKIPDGAELFDFSQRLFEKWKPGQVGKDNGGLFLIFAAERKMRIHTGKGMEGALPDARCKQIIEDRITPELRAGNREAAINAGVDAMIAAAKGEYQGNRKTRLDGHSGGRSFPWPLIIIVIFIVIKTLSSGRRSKYYNAGGWTYAAGGSTWGGDDGGFSSGGGGFSSGSSGGDSGGGFSGGGGDSGGGGASGGW
jgi:uncharacterized protein